MASDFDAQVAELRKTVAAKKTNKSKADCTPKENTAKSDTITPEAQALFDRLCLEFRTQVAA